MNILFLEIHPSKRLHLTTWKLKTPGGILVFQVLVQVCLFPAPPFSSRIFPPDFPAGKCRRLCSPPIIVRPGKQTGELHHHHVRPAGHHNQQYKTSLEGDILWDSRLKSRLRSSLAWPHAAPSSQDTGPSTTHGARPSGQDFLPSMEEEWQYSPSSLGGRTCSTSSTLSSNL